MAFSTVTSLFFVRHAAEDKVECRLRGEKLAYGTATAWGTSGSISQMTIFSISGYNTNEPAVTPAPQPTIRTERGCVW